MSFVMNIKKQIYKQNSLTKVDDVGTWNTPEDSDRVTYKSGKAMEKFAATNVYKVVTVIVS